jgi:hypothetical protein
MVSVNPFGFNPATATNTLSLFKDAPDAQVSARIVAPSIVASKGNQLSTIADLAAKLIDIKSGNGRDANADESRPTPGHAGDGSRPLTAAERAAEKANWEGYYGAMQGDVVANLPEKAIEAMLTVDYYANDPSFQEAIKNGTVTVRRGDEVGIANPPPLNISFDNDGYYQGVLGGGSYSLNPPADLASMVEGRLIARADGQNAAVGGIGSVSYYVTWPRSA